jgi:hypothetical protein
MPKSLSRVAIFVLIVVALWRLDVAAKWIGFDDMLNYAKTSACILGHPLPTDPEERKIIDDHRPIRYEPHPGINVPYIEFDLEYPPLLLIPILIPQFFTEMFDPYCRIFTLEMLLCFAGTIWLLRRMNRQLGPRRPMSGWYIAGLSAVFAICMATFITRRFDMVPAFFAGAALVAEFAAVFPLAGLLLGLGAALKIWPGFLLAIFVLSAWADGDRRRILQLVGAAAVGFLVPHLPFIVVGGRAAFSYLSYHGARGVQIESLWGNLATIISRTMSLDSYYEWSFGAYNIASKSGWTAHFVTLSYLAMLGSFGLILKRTWAAIRVTEAGSIERRRVTVTASAGLVLATIATAKVLSPQYIVWLFPVVYVVPGIFGRRIRLGAIVASILTLPILPYLYRHWILTGSWPGLMLVFARNLTLVWLVWQALRALQAMAQPKPVPSVEPEPEAQPA